MRSHYYIVDKKKFKKFKTINDIGVDYLFL